jgi:sulfite exporter TauE/SafE/copper chaperone CopZ
MFCAHCQNRIEGELRKAQGILAVSVKYRKGTAYVAFDDSKISVKEIINIIDSLEDYKASEQKDNVKPALAWTPLQIAGILIIILALSALLRAFSVSPAAASFPLASSGMGWGMVLLIGLLTSVHCIAMCGGINLSQSLNSAPDLSQPKPAQLVFPGMLYNAGRLVSYTLVGIIVGALGSVITVSDRFRAVVLFIAGLFMVLMGINMLGLFPFLRRFTPHLPSFLTGKIEGQRAGRGPLVIGFLNGFMPCGPLQAMQLYALSTGSPLYGGMAMFLFCAGTIPLMFTLGAAGGILSGIKGKSFSRRAMQIGAILVASMGLVMLSNGLSSSGSVFNSSPAIASSEAEKEAPKEEVQIINSTLIPGRYPAITVQQGVPVKWIINAPRNNINGCNYRMSISEYGIVHTFKPGENVIEFTPEKTGRFRYSCWMSMIQSTITVM